MSARSATILVTLLFISSAAAASVQQGISVSHFENLERVDVRDSLGEVRQDIASIEPINVSFNAMGRMFELRLEPNASLLAAIPPAQRVGDSIPYRGAIIGVAGSWARIVMTDGLPAGLVWDGETLYALEIPGDSVLDASTPIVYRMADATIAAGAMSCGGSSMARDGATAFASVVGELAEVTQQSAGALSQITIGAVGDYEFTTAKGANAQSAILTRLNNVDGIFSQQVGVQINVPVIDTFADSGDPFSNTSDPSALLDELKDYRIASENQRYQGLTHLYTGRDLAGSTVGNANQGALCSYGFGVGLSEGNRSAAIDSLIAAHEIGHNFGAPHDGEAGSPCAAEPSSYLMATTLSGSDQFSACSIAEMQDDIAQAACISAVPNTDISIGFSDAPSSALVGDTLHVTLNVSNNGSEPAQDVVLGITLPSHVSLISASGPTATCDGGAGTVSCQLSEVAGGGATSVVLVTEAIAAGAGIFEATISASADDQLDNNSDTFELTVEQGGVNLVVNVPASGQVAQNQETVVSATLENLASLDATAVTISISLDSGLRADSATWSIGTCSVAAQRIDCEASLFAAQSDSTVSIVVAGLSAGTWNYSISLASSETDVDPTDNSGQGSISVTTSGNDGGDTGGGGGGSGGGGGLGWCFLLLLGWRAHIVARR